jgi:hypothetical protein
MKLNNTETEKRRTWVVVWDENKKDKPQIEKE